MDLRQGSVRVPSRRRARPDHDAARARPRAEPTSFGEALTAVAEVCRGARVGVITGGRLLDEDAYALSKLARTVLRTNDLDHRRGTGRRVGRAGGAPGTDARSRTRTSSRPRRSWWRASTPSRRCRSCTFGCARLPSAAPGSWSSRRAARACTTSPTHVLVSPGDEFAALLRSRGDRRGSMARSPALRRARGRRVRGSRSTTAPPTRRSPPRRRTVRGSRGPPPRRRSRRVARRRAPGVRTGRPHARRGRGPCRDRGRVGAVDDREPGRDSHAISCGLRRAQLDVLSCVGVDPLRDLPTPRSRAARCRTSTRWWCSRWSSAISSPTRACSCPPRRSSSAKGTSSDWEGRRQRVHPTCGRPTGSAVPTGRSSPGSRLACGGDLGFDTLDELHEEMAGLLVPAAGRVADRRRARAAARR